MSQTSKLCPSFFIEPIYSLISWNGVKQVPHLNSTRFWSSRPLLIHFERRSVQSRRHDSKNRRHNHNHNMPKAKWSIFCIRIDSYRTLNLDQPGNPTQANMPTLFEHTKEWRIVKLMQRTKRDQRESFSKIIISAPPRSPGLSAWPASSMHRQAWRVRKREAIETKSRRLYKAMLS